jgi:hypothetical protein
MSDGEDTASSTGSITANPMKDGAANAAAPEETGAGAGAKSDDAYALTKSDAQLYAKAVGSPTNFHQVHLRGPLSCSLRSSRRSCASFA